MTIVKPTPNNPITSTWTDAVTAVANGFYASVDVSEFSPNQTITTSEADIAGVTATFSITGTAGFALVTLHLAAQVTTAAAGQLVAARLAVDGVTQTREGHIPAAALGRASCTPTWIVALAAGPHTLKGRVIMGAGVAANTEYLYTGMTIFVLDLP